VRGDKTMNDAKRTVKQKALQGMMEYLFISFYLGVVFSLFTVYKVVILAEHNIDFAPHGFAILNALALAKIMLVAQELHFAEQLRDAPLIYPTLLKSFAFSILLACFKIAEHTVVGMFHGKSFYAAIASGAEGSWTATATITALLFVVLVPFFGYTELRRVFGKDRLEGAFFRPRHLLNLPPTLS
jgi:hypothetical protein